MYVDYGYYKEGLINVVRKGASGEQEIKDMMQRLRNAPPLEFAGSPVIQIQDYKTGIEKILKPERNQYSPCQNRMYCSFIPKMAAKFRYGLLVLNLKLSSI